MKSRSNPAYEIATSLTLLAMTALVGYLQQMSYFLEIKRFLKRVYPRFVTQVKPTLAEEVPVFVFHTVRRVTFEEQLTFLKRNSYQTLDADQLFSFIVTGEKVPNRSILLTFDDGERSLYRVAFPLLKKFGFRATAFIVPSFIKETAEEPPNMKTTQSEKQWLNWHEIEEMQRSGLIDFQSHTLGHERMFIGKEVMDFFHPGFFFDGLGLDVPSVLDKESYVKLKELGAPVYRMGSRMEDALRFFDDETLRKECIQYVIEHGKGSFFKKRKWRKTLKHLVKVFQEGRKSAGYFESSHGQKQAISHSLEKSLTILQERLNKEITHLAYPWGYAGKLAVNLSREAGYKTNFWGPLPEVRKNSIGGNPFYISRLKDDYLFRLPGKGRKPLREILKYKLKRRVQMKDIY